MLISLISALSLFSCLQFTLSTNVNQVVSSILVDIKYNTNNRPLTYLLSNDILQLLTKQMKTKLNQPQFFCFNILDLYPETQLKSLPNNEESDTILIFYGIESLNQQNRPKLNFLHSLSDSIAMYSNTYVLLIWDTKIQPVEEENIQQYLFQFLSSGGSTINPDALIGRISRFHLTPLTEFKFSSEVCSSKLFQNRKRTTEAAEVNESSSTSWLIVVLTIVVILVLGRYFQSGTEKNQKVDKKPQKNVKEVNEVKVEKENEVHVSSPRSPIKENDNLRTKKPQLQQQFQQQQQQQQFHQKQKQVRKQEQEEEQQEEEEEHNSNMTEEIPQEEVKQ